MSPDLPRIAVVILHYKTIADTLACLDSVAASTEPAHWIIVVDNGAGAAPRIMEGLSGLGRADGTPPLLLRADDLQGLRRLLANPETGQEKGKLFCIEAAKNRGYGAGNNLGLALALDLGADAVWLLNNDTLAAPDALKAMREKLFSDSRAGLCGPLVRYLDRPDTVQCRGGGRTNHWTGLSRLNGCNMPVARALEADEAGVEANLNFIYGAAVMASRDFLTSVGLMDEGFFIYCEEQDWAMRAAGRFALLYASRAHVWHREGASTGWSAKSGNLFAVKHLIRSRLLLAKKHKPASLPIVSLAILFAMARGLARRLKNKLAATERPFEALKDLVRRAILLGAETPRTIKKLPLPLITGPARPVPAPRVLVHSSAAFSTTPCCIFSHYSPEPAVAPPVYRYLAALKQAGYAIFFVSTAPSLQEAEVQMLGDFCQAVLCRDNEGLDFASWKSVLDAYPDIRSAPELLLANDSVYIHAPGLARVFAAMRDVDCDFWGLTESLEKRPHLQSYFLLFRRPALEHPAFGAFWDSVGILRQKKTIIDRYEVGLSRALVRAGLKTAAYVPAFGAQNPTLAHPLKLMDDFGLPALKCVCLRDNPLRVPLHGWERFFEPDEARDIREQAARRGAPLPQAPLPEISVLLPTYNGAAFLKQLLDSLPQGPQIRLAARDDGSDDATLALLAEQQQRLGDKMEVHSGRRLGVAGNYGWLLAHCRSPYFLLADQDDVWEAEKLPALWEAMQRLEREYGRKLPLLVYSDAGLIDEKGGLLSPSFFEARGTPPLWGENFQNTLVFSPAPGCTMMGNLALARSALPLPEEAFMHDWWLLLVAGALGGVRVVNAPLVRYRQHARNVLGAGSRDLRSLSQKLLPGPKSSRLLVRQTQIQAGVLLQRHSREMTDKHRLICEAWSSMPEKNRLRRAICMLRHSFAKPGKLRNAFFYLCS